jgi:polyisoprenoid-binding protein YceI
VSAVEPTKAIARGIARGIAQGVAAGHWRVLCGETMAAFTVRDKLVATVRGTIPVQAGTVVMDEGGRVVSGRLELHVPGVHTANSHRDRDLRKPRFLDAEGHPRIVVEVGAAVPDATGWDLEGMLTARGASTPITLRAVLDDVSGDRARLHLSGRLDRSGLGIKVPTFVVGRHVDIEVTAVFGRDVWTGGSGEAG